MRYYLALKADAGSVPCSTTITQNPNPYPVGIFFARSPRKRNTASRA